MTTGKNNDIASFSDDLFFIHSEHDYENKTIQQCFDAVGIFVAIVDLTGNIKLINKKGEEVLGFAKADIIDKNFVDDYIINTRKKEVKRLFHSLISVSSAANEMLVPFDNVHYHIHTRNNGTIIIESKNIFVVDTNNVVKGIIISGKDVTGHIKSKDSLKRDISFYKILANNIPNINLFLFDTKLTFILAEGSEMKSNGFSKKTFEGINLKNISSKTISGIWLPLFEKALQGKSVSSEYVYKNKHYVLWVFPLKNKDGDIYSGIAITQDITQQKETQHQLKKSKSIAEQANTAKSEFLARVSHEIRTPLNAILGFCEQIKQTELDDKQKEYVNIIDKSSEHLLGLINDILIISKIEARQINFETAPFKIEHTAKYVYNSLKTKAEEKGIRFNYSIDKKLEGVLKGDSFRLRQILLNFLSNAIKFTSNGYVDLRCFLLEETEQEQTVRFDIIDTGIGIKAKHLNSIFDQFKQADSSITKQFGGTGLGLTICKNLIEMQNGSLSVTSKEGMGSTFSFSITYKKGNEEEFLQDDLDDVNTERLQDVSILLIDDDSVNRLLCKTILDKYNCNLDIANNGAEAIQKAKENKYDVVLLDIHLPDINGIEVAKYIRKKLKDNDTKIVAVTAAIMKNEIEKYYKAKINDFLTKPYKEIHLYNKICEVLQLKRGNSVKTKQEIILKEEIKPKNYNLDELRLMTNSNKDLFNDMLDTFIENSKTAINDMQKHLSDKNWEQIGEVAHKILPSYQHLEVHSLTSKLKLIKEKAIIAPDYNDLPKLVENTILQMKELTKNLEFEKE